RTQMCTHVVGLENEVMTSAHSVIECADTIGKYRLLAVGGAAPFPGRPCDRQQRASMATGASTRGEGRQQADAKP
ncbi:MAG: hypothetical protein OXF51_01115, partial [Alphaproteobacteria bacterium]|nr:hypothetical protein [Alphaproteobacteria bacterium]